jgi:hypothetical protein
MSQSLPYGYWTYGGKDGLYGAESTLQEQPDGSIRIVKDPDYPAVLEDRYILWAVKNDKAALQSFNDRLPTMDPVSQTRLNDLVARYPAHFVVRQDSTTMSDNLQQKQVVQTRQDDTANPYLEKPKKPGSPSRTNTKPDAYPATTETVSSGSGVSISIPTSLRYTTTVSGLPSGLVWNGSVVRGTAPTTASGESYRISVSRVNSLGSSLGYLTLVVTP